MLLQAKCTGYIIKCNKILTISRFVFEKYLRGFCFVKKWRQIKHLFVPQKPHHLIMNMLDKQMFLDRQDAVSKKRFPWNIQGNLYRWQIAGATCAIVILDHYIDDFSFYENQLFHSLSIQYFFNIFISQHDFLHSFGVEV